VTLKRYNFSEIYCDINFHDPAVSIAYVTPGSEFRRTAILVLLLRRYLVFTKAHKHTGKCN